MDDKRLRNDVVAALDWEPSIDASDIGVQAERGVITLTGRVGTWVQRHTAEKVTKRVKGVRGLITHVEIIPTFIAQNDDEQLAVCAVTAIDWNVAVPKGRVQVEVKSGAITLTGQVDWDYQRRAAENSVIALEGVRFVHNDITIARKPDVKNVKTRILSALKRDAELQAQDITIEVAGGKVTLKGTVDRWHERDVVERAAWATPGVTLVDDQLLVR